MKRISVGSLEENCLVSTKSIGSRWVFKVKRDSLGNIHCYKARVVATGFAQIEGIHYTETYASTTRFDTIRILLAIAFKRKMTIMQFDIKTAFLPGELTAEVHMDVPEGVTELIDMVYRLKKSLYGLKQTPRCWNQKFHNFLQGFGGRQCHPDRCVYIGDFQEVLS